MTSETSQPDLTIVVPVYNEEEALPPFLDELLPFAEEHGLRVILVDDGSTDSSADILANLDRAAVQVLSHKVNRGYGGALKTGIRAVTTTYAITVDADGQHRPEDVLALYHAARKHDADMVIGSRAGQKDASMARAFAKRCIRLLARTLMYVPVQDLNSGMKLTNARLAQAAIGLCPDTMAFSDTIALVFLNNRHRVIEEPITIRERRHGTSTIGLRDAFGTVRAIINMVMLFHPLNLFLPAAAFLAVFGLLWTGRCYIISRVVSTGAAVLLLSALLTLLLGLVAEQLSEIRRELAARDITLPRGTPPHEGPRL